MLHDFLALWKDTHPDIPILSQSGVRQAPINRFRFLVWLEACPQVRFPSSVALVPHDLLATDREGSPIPQQDMDVGTVHASHQCDAPTKDRHAVATFDPPFLLPPRIPAFAPLHEQVASG